MIGIYKITNKINGHCYIGQSRNIDKRWRDHKIASHNKNDKGYNYPLYQAFRKYGIDNFSFEVIEECSINLLNEKEHYWIKHYSPIYNQTNGGDYQVNKSKLSYEDVEKIYKILLDETQNDINYVQIAAMFNVHPDTIRNINFGRSWINENLNYPLRISPHDYTRIDKKIYYCKICKKEVSKNASYCLDCFHKLQKQQSLDSMIVSREELKKIIRTKPFVQIGQDFGVSDNAIRKWCEKYNLPRTKKEINSYSDEEWELI